ncbi:DUF4252 domain-containing protein [Candidatus Poribacteria bacterium]|nr:DUF4252 domain-containing protein [Candidatus Poribacteria bacterium]
MKLQKHFIRLFTLLFLVASLTLMHSAVAQQKKSDKTGRKGLILFDFPESLEAKVEVNLTAKLISLVTKSVSNQPEVVELIQMLDGIYVRTYDRATIDEKKLVNYFKEKLKEDEWEILVKIEEKSETVEINLLFDEEKVYGIFAIIIPKRSGEATFVNIVGEIAPEHIEELLGNLSNFGAVDIDFGDKLKGQWKREDIGDKATVMILGSTFFTNPRINRFNVRMDDVLAPKRQSEMEQLVTQLKAFGPTKIAVYTDQSYDAELNANYQGYLEGTYELTRNYKDQIGFRLAKQMGHSKLYGIAHWPKHKPILDKIDDDLMDFDTFAEMHNQEHLLPTMVSDGQKVRRSADGTLWVEQQEYEPLIDMYIRMNEPEQIYVDHQPYLRTARIGLKDQYPGANWVAHWWYAHNLKNFVNLTRITESTDDRILLIVGAGHVYLIQQFLEDSGDYIVESPLQYLNPAATD